MSTVLYTANNYVGIVKLLYFVMSQLLFFRPGSSSSTSLPGLRFLLELGKFRFTRLQ